MSDVIGQKLSEMLTKAPAAPEVKSGAGRGPTGRLRNFKSMSDAKLVGVYMLLDTENDDAEAISAAKQEMAGRGMPA